MLAIDLYFDLDKQEEALIHARTDLQQQVEHSQMLLEKLVDDKLAPKQEAIQTAPTNLEPVQSRRPSWGKIRQDYETKQRAAYWAQRIADQEAADAAVADKKVAEGERN